jgi:hypothetical protein
MEGDMERFLAQRGPRRFSRRSLLLALAGLGLSMPACEFSQLFAWNGGKPTLFGYATAPNYDTRIKTVRVKIFKNPTFWSVVPVPGLEMQLTQALVRAIETNTPYKVVAGDADTEISGSIMSFVKLALNYNQLNEQRDVETTLTASVVWKNLRTGEILSAPAQRAVEPLPPAGLLPNQVDPLNAPAAVPGVMQAPLITGGISPGGQQATMSNGQQATTSGGSATTPPPTPGVPFPGGTNAPGPSGGPPMPTPPGLLPGMVPMGVIVRSVASFRPEIGQSISTAMQDNVDQLAIQIVSMMEKPW